MYKLCFYVIGLEKSNASTLDIKVSGIPRVENVSQVNAATEK
jgi:hypothetical protein